MIKARLSAEGASWVWLGSARAFGPSSSALKSSAEFDSFFWESGFSKHPVPDTVNPCRAGFNDRHQPVVSSICTPYNGCQASSALRHRPDIQFAVDQARAGHSALIQTLLGPHSDHLDGVRVVTPNLRRRPACQPIEPNARGFGTFTLRWPLPSAFRTSVWEPLGAIHGQPASHVRTEAFAPLKLAFLSPGPPFPPSGWPVTKESSPHNYLFS